MKHENTNPHIPKPFDASFETSSIHTFLRAGKGRSFPKSNVVRATFIFHV